MGKIKSVAYVETVDAGADEKRSIYRVKEGKIRVIKFTTIAQSGALGYLYISIYRGDEQVIPTRNEITCDLAQLTVDADVEYYRGEDVLMRVRNTSANALAVQGILTYEVLD